MTEALQVCVAVSSLSLPPPHPPPFSPAPPLIIFVFACFLLTHTRNIFRYARREALLSVKSRHSCDWNHRSNTEWFCLFFFFFVFFFFFFFVFVFFFFFFVFFFFFFFCVSQLISGGWGSDPGRVIPVA